MTAYALAQFVIEDRARYQRYVARFAESLSGFDGRLLAADEHPTVVEGVATVDKVVIIEFASRGEFERWATSPTYREISKDRTSSTRGTVLLVTGLDRGPVLG